MIKIRSSAQAATSQHRRVMRGEPSRAASFTFKCAAAVALMSLAWTPLRAGDLGAEMQSFFTSMGGLSTHTSPGAYKGQGMNVYMGGELQVRYPVRTYQLMSYSLPSIKAGCGGIDAFMGSFSHINSQQFKDMLQQIGSATVGLLFKAALAAINPLIESKLSELGMDVKMEGIFSRNSCQMAQSLVNGMSGMTGMSSASACVSMAQSLYGDDDAAARRRCKTEAVKVNSDAKNSADPDANALAKRNINIVWQALSATPFSKEQKELLINIAGTVIINQPLDSGGNSTGTKTIDPSLDSINVIMNGHTDGSTSDTVKVEGYWRCVDADCLNMKQVPIEYTPFSILVNKQLQAIADKINNRVKLQSPDIDFINLSSIPVHKMLVLGYQAGANNVGLGVQQLYIERFSKVIALDYAFGFLNQGLKNARVYLSAVEQIGSDEAKASKDIYQRLDARLQALETERNAALAKIGNIDTIVSHMERVERQMRQGIGGPLRTMLDFGALMAGKGSQG